MDLTQHSMHYALLKEKWSPVSGEIDLLIFDDARKVQQRIIMSPTTTRAVEIPPKTWHAYVSKQSGTLALEVKDAHTPQHLRTISHRGRLRKIALRRQPILPGCSTHNPNKSKHLFTLVLPCLVL